MPVETLVDINFIGGRVIVRHDYPTTLISKRIAAVKSRAADISPPLRAFRQQWHDQNKTLFAAEGIPKWPRLSPAYAQRKARIAPGKSILRLTDRLYNSLTTKTPDSIYEVGPRSLRVGTMVPYSKYHTARRPHVHLLKITFDRLSAEVFKYIARPLSERN